MTYESLLILVAFPVLLVALFYVPLANVGVDLADEGYLLFGSKAVVEGAVPIRDFRAYDPGRYYWCALWIKAFGCKFAAIRFAMAFIMVGSLSLSATTIYLATMDWLLSVMVCLVSFVWMRPHHKQIEIFFSILTVFFLSHLLQTYFVPYALILGVLIGGSLFFGVNIFIYVGGATALVAAVQADSLSLLDHRTELAWLAIGLFLGLLPFGLMFLKYPGMASAYWEKKIVTIIRRGTANLRLPIPWIWARDTPQLSHLAPSRRWFFKALFTLAPVIYGGILVSYIAAPSLSNQRPMELAAVASCVGLVYLHHGFSRADVPHLCQAIHPLLIAVFALMAFFVPGHWASLSAFILACLSAWAILPNFDERFQYLSARKQYVRYFTGSEILRVRKHQADRLSHLGRLINRHSGKGEKIFAAPMLAGIYPLFERMPAAYDIFPVYPASRSSQLLMIKQLEQANIAIAIIKDVPLDCRPELQFSNNYDLVFKYFINNFQEISENNGIKGFLIFIRTKN